MWGNVLITEHSIDCQIRFSAKILINCKLATEKIQNKMYNHGCMTETSI